MAGEAREANDVAIEKWVKYFNSKVRSVQFAENEWVLLKELNFQGKNQKLAETFKWHKSVWQWHCAIEKMKTVYGKHNQIVLQNWQWNTDSKIMV